MPPRPSAPEAGWREPGPLAVRLMAIAWPAFLAACMLELLVFALVDPSRLEWSGRPLAASRQAIYSIAFFAFWAIAGGACWMTSALRMAPNSGEGRPGGSLSSYKG